MAAQTSRGDFDENGDWNNESTNKTAVREILELLLPLVFSAIFSKIQSESHVNRSCSQSSGFFIFISDGGKLIGWFRILFFTFLRLYGFIFCSPAVLLRRFSVIKCFWFYSVASSCFPFVPFLSYCCRCCSFRCFCSFLFCYFTSCFNMFCLSSLAFPIWYVLYRRLTFMTLLCLYHHVSYLYLPSFLVLYV